MAFIATNASDPNAQLKQDLLDLRLQERANTS